MKQLAMQIRLALNLGLQKMLNLFSLREAISDLPARKKFKQYIEAKKETRAAATQAKGSPHSDSKTYNHPRR